MAAERRGEYHDTPDAADRDRAAHTSVPDTSAPGTAADDPAARRDSDAPGAAAVSEAPFGLPVLAELPTLAAVLDRLTVADTALLDTVAGLADLLDDDTVQHTTGVGIEHWLATIATQTRMDRRLLLRACRLLHRLPTLDHAVRTHRISFAQLRGLTIGLRTTPTRLDDQTDQLLAALLDGLDQFDHPDPDTLVRQLIAGLDELDPDDLTDRQHQATAGRYLHLQPRLDGTGGRLVAELDATGTALIDAATTPTPDQITTAGSHQAARLDLLLARLTTNTPPPGPDRDPSGEAADPTHGRPDQHPHGYPGPLPPPQLLLRLPFAALLDDHLPADLLTTLTGGRLRLTSPAARELLDRAGTRLRTIIIDDAGSVIGVGRAQRHPPGWLTDTLTAIHDTCTGPGCDRPARTTQIDHATPWWPTTPDTPAGTTDLDNLGPLCATTNRAKEAAGWTTQQRLSGTRTWTHTRSGLTTTTIPTTWRPPNDPRRQQPTRPTPPGHPPGPPDPAPDQRGDPGDPGDQGDPPDQGDPGDDLPF